MNPQQLRQQLLAALRKPTYRPLALEALGKSLNVPKHDRKKFAHEVRSLLSTGALAYIDNNRLTLAQQKTSQQKQPARSPKNGSSSRRPKSTFTQQKSDTGNSTQSPRPIFSPNKNNSMPTPKKSPQQNNTPKPRHVTPVAKPAPSPSQKTKRLPSTPGTSAPHSTRGSAAEESYSLAASRYSLVGGKAAPAPGTFVGKIRFRQSGAAFLSLPKNPDNPNQPSGIQIESYDTSTALANDTVEVRLVPKKKRLARRSASRAAFADEPSGQVTAILERANPTIVGTLTLNRSGATVSPDDPRFIHQIHVPKPSDPNATTGSKVLVKLHEWKNRRDPINGIITELLGRTFEPTAELLGIYRKFHLAESFPAEVTAAANAIPNSVSESDTANRIDCRQLLTLTIDPDDAKDFDDALSIETHPDGATTIGIHIADVSYYVRPDTALDNEAKLRGNSTYLVGTVIPMLPTKLSNGLCSLVEAQDRLTKTVFLTFNPDLSLRKSSLANTVIRSRKRLTYKQAYAFLFTDDLNKIRQLPLPPAHQTGSTGVALNSLSDPQLREIQTAVRTLWKIAANLRAKRMAHGSLDLDMPETKILVDPQGYASQLVKVENDESHQLIEEFMLSANETVAHLTRTKHIPSLYRVHDDPDADRLQEFSDELEAHSIKAGDLTHRSEITRILKLLETHPQGHLLRTDLLRSLKKACYRNSPDGHYGLNKKDYTHFTSPIRRYSDLAVHRAVNPFMATSTNTDSSTVPQRRAPNAPGEAAMSALAEHLSETELNSTEAERESVKIKLLEYFERELAKTPLTQFPAIVTDQNPIGIFIELTESLVSGLIPRTALPRNKPTPEIGTQLTVEVLRVDRFKRLIDFKPTTTPAKSTPTSAPTTGTSTKSTTKSPSLQSQLPLPKKHSRLFRRSHKK